MEIYVKISLISIFSLFFLVSNHDFVIYIDFTMSQRQTQQLMRSQIRSHIEYLIRTYNIIVLILYSKLVRNVVALAVLIRFDDGS